MIQRINLFHERVKGLTYKRMGLISLAAFVGLTALIFLQTYRVSHAKSLLVALASEADEIKNNQGIGTKDLPSTPVNPIETITISMMTEPMWSDVLEVVSKALSDGIWLGEITGDSKEGGQVTLQGTAYQGRVVPGFADRLRSYNVFSRVNILASEASSNEPDAPLGFKVQAKTKPK